jgi:beta-phosphoglucomutase family hydrolase
MSIKGLIFDLDGVLVDTVPTHYRAWARMFHEFGYEFGRKEYLTLVDGRLRYDGARAVMTDVDEATVIERANRKNQYYLEAIDRGEFNIFESALRQVRAFHAAGYKLAAASSSANVRHILETIGILDLFDTVVGGPDVEKGKPHPEIFLTAAEGLGLSVEECVVVEDAESGVAAAKAGGFFCYGLRYDNDDAELPHSANLELADRIIGSLEEMDPENVTSAR